MAWAWIFCHAALCKFGCLCQLFTYIFLMFGPSRSDLLIGEWVSWMCPATAMMFVGNVLSMGVTSLKRKRSSLDLGAIMENRTPGPPGEEPVSTDEADSFVNKSEAEKVPEKPNLPIHETGGHDDSPWELVDIEDENTLHTGTRGGSNSASWSVLIIAVISEHHCTVPQYVHWIWDSCISQALWLLLCNSYHSRCAIAVCSTGRKLCQHSWL